MGESNDRLRWQLVSGFLRQLHLKSVSERFNPRLVLAAFNFVNGGVSIALVAIVAHVTQEAFIFPSLGATAFLLFYIPLSMQASPRNTLYGHLIGALAGWSSLWLFNLEGVAATVAGNVEWPRVAASALGLGITSSVMMLLRVVHPPAAATSLVVSLGLMPSLTQIPILMAGVGMLLIQAFVINHMAGIPYPLWRRKLRVEK